MLCGRSTNMEELPLPPCRSRAARTAAIMVKYKSKVTQSFIKKMCGFSRITKHRSHFLTTV